MALPIGHLLGAAGQCSRQLRGVVGEWPSYAELRLRDGGAETLTLGTAVLC